MKVSMKDILMANYGAKYCDVPALGIEVECERNNPEVRAAGWEAKGDGSLRDDGVEFVSRGPVPFDKVSDHLTNFCNAVANEDGHFVHNYRTSTHVHLNVAPLSPQQFGVLILEYLYLEDWFFSKCNEDRRTGPYAVPLADASNMLRMLAKDIADEFKHGMVGTLGLEPKYCGLSFYRLRDLGTVEFRMKHGTNSIDELSEWCGDIMQLYDDALSYEGKFDIKCMQQHALAMATADIDRRNDEVVTINSLHVVDQLLHIYRHLGDRQPAGRKESRRVHNRHRQFELRVDHGIDMDAAINELLDAPAEAPQRVRVRPPADAHAFWANQWEPEPAPPIPRPAAPRPDAMPEPLPANHGNQRHPVYPDGLVRAWLESQARRNGMGLEHYAMQVLANNEGE